MSKIIRYTNSGHRFEIEGILEAGYSVIVTVIPANGYEFVQWLTGLPNITEIDPDDEGHRRFSIYIDECGLSFASLFHPAPIPPEPTPETCDKSAIYNVLVQILYGKDVAGEMPWDSSEDISCDAIDSELDSILNGGTVVYHTITALPNNPSFGTVNGGGRYVENRQVILTAIANEGYSFKEWDDNVTTETRSITVTGDATFIAIFEEIIEDTFSVMLDEKDNLIFLDSKGEKVDLGLIEQLDDVTFVFSGDLSNTLVTYTDEIGEEKPINVNGKYEDHNNITLEPEMIISADVESNPDRKTYRFEKI